LVSHQQQQYNPSFFMWKRPSSCPEFLQDDRIRIAIKDI
jgi:hypothetical protein